MIMNTILGCSPKEHKIGHLSIQNQARRFERRDWLMGGRTGTPTYSQHVLPSTRDTDVFMVVNQQL